MTQRQQVGAPDPPGSSAPINEGAPRLASFGLRNEGMGAGPIYPSGCTNSSKEIPALTDRQHRYTPPE